MKLVNRKIVEVNSTTKAKKVYIHSENGLKIVTDKALSSSFSTDNLLNIFKTTFLPAGYPHSVKDEYIVYQGWDSFQGISTYIRSVLTTRSVLAGAGVGDTTTTPLAAALSWVLRDGIGMIGSLSFAYHFSDLFEVNTKEWRLMADVFNNIGLTLDLLSSSFPKYFLVLTSVSALSKACCGLVAGATKARISAHFANKGHLADVTAKEGTQETAVSLCGLLLGMLVAQCIGNDEFTTWIAFILLLTIHQYANYQLIRVLVLDTLNPQRCLIITRILMETKEENKEKLKERISPKAISLRETLWTPVVLHVSGPIVASSLSTALEGFDALEHNGLLDSGNFRTARTLTQQWLNQWSTENFLIGFDIQGRLSIYLAEKATFQCAVKSYIIAMYIDIKMKQSGGSLQKGIYTTESGGSNENRFRNKNPHLLTLRKKYIILLGELADKALVWYNSKVATILESTGWDFAEWAALSGANETWRYAITAEGKME